jgi:hypothetical protein
MIGSMTSRTSMRQLGFMAEPVRTVEPDGSVNQAWPSEFSPIVGRIDQRTRQDETNNGRDGLFATFLLVTPSPVEGRGRVLDEDTQLLYEIVGPPWTVYDSRGIHHYEASLERVSG